MKSGFISVVGRANVGKSTLMEKILREKISIISNKPQTTRDKIQIIYNDEDSQIIFIDTPGIQTPKNKLQEKLFEFSEDSLKESDIVTFVIDNSLEIGRLDNEIIEMLKGIHVPKILLINKTDLLSEEEFETIKEKFEAMNMFEAIIGISALEETNIDNYIEQIKSMLDVGPAYYDRDMITDKSERFIVSEIIREKALNNLSYEVPHGIAVRIDNFKERDNKKLIDIDATIIVEKNSHKEIVIGKGGSMVKKIGIEARKEIEKFLDSKVNLKLWVKVEKDWRKKEKLVDRFGYK
ncbi:MULTISPECIES: GTPase Era [Anaerococcus]|jgi:GTP-binding protein era|uniref:GTPase Era n=1 Tax=Anaerococcus nagyae TaxID=1755241 RepID=A0A3E2TKS2_9FIRM|nr:MULTISPECIES: GTPase Era [Anaerococcus]MBP2069008.1 GTP-binding protein Era [Anaerococcus nagyae]MDU2565324.1 GTPase Era [Anaerococcus sp.]RGB77979.1 GTPase Era [Anaerococcus nagyae]